MRSLSLAMLLLICSIAIGQRYNGSSSWTWPGDLGVHLQRHGFSHSQVSGLSRREKQGYHDRIHNIVRRGYPVVGDVNLVFWRCPYCGAWHER